MFLVCRGGVDWREGVIRTNVAAGDSDIRVLRIMVGWHDTEGFASLHPRLRTTRSARAFDLSGRAAVKLVIVSLSKAVHPTDWGAWKSKKRDSTTVNTIAEPYFLSLVNFYRTAIIKNNNPEVCLFSRDNRVLRLQT